MAPLQLLHVSMAPLQWPPPVLQWELQRQCLQMGQCAEPPGCTSAQELEKEHAAASGSRLSEVNVASMEKDQAPYSECLSLQEELDKTTILKSNTAGINWNIWISPIDCFHFNIYKVVEPSKTSCKHRPFAQKAGGSQEQLQGKGQEQHTAVGRGMAELPGKLHRELRKADRGLLVHPGSKPHQLAPMGCSFCKQWTKQAAAKQHYKGALRNFKRPCSLTDQQ
ncbi:hypothetical protein UY3_14808 [Chelonia mydas]|uniref:Uncharacterized protein n=1 Tax=Chelonia mydas TaxID=8469 RepID=M7BIU1_CHEMY|nr:hypothetical protein UY3_14808 [Chelonia mydas]